jgi:hypothetical protein
MLKGYHASALIRDPELVWKPIHVLIAQHVAYQIYLGCFAAAGGGMGCWHLWA